MRAAVDTETAHDIRHRCVRVALNVETIFWLALVLALLPLMYDAARAMWLHWVPVQDDAFAAFRVHDVFGSLTPLVGMPAGGLGHQAGTQLRQLGPMEFWLLAVPYRALGSSSDGIILGVLLLAVGAVAGIAVVARRLGGPLFAVFALLIETCMVWSFGADLARRPYNPSVAVLPLLLLVLLSAAVARGDFLLLPGFAFVASFVAQAHLSDVPVVAALTTWVVLAVALTRRHQSGRHNRRALQRIVVGTICVAAVCWSGPILQEFVRSGNLTNLWHGLAGPAGVVNGTHFGLTQVASHVATPWGLVRHPAPVEHDLNWSWVAIALHFAPAAAMSVALFVIAVRRKQPQTTFTVGMAVVMIACSEFTVSQAPVSLFSGANGLYTWLLWPLAAGFWLLILLAAMDLIDRLRIAPLALGALTLLLLAPTAYFARVDRSKDPEHFGDIGGPRQVAIAKIVTALHESLPHDDVERVVVEPDDQGILADVVAAVLFELYPKGPQLVVDTRDTILPDLFKGPRLLAGHHVNGTVYITRGKVPARSNRRLLTRTGLDAGANREFIGIEQAIRAELSITPLHLTPKGRNEAKIQQLLTKCCATRRRLVDHLIANGILAQWYRSGFVTRPTLSRRLLVRDEALGKMANPEFAFQITYKPSRRR